MHPVLFKIPLPDFLNALFGNELTIYSYGAFIVLGALLGVTYLTIESKKQFDVPFDKINTLFLILLFSAVFGGKFFLIFEDFSFYTSNPSALIKGRGFVFFGSLLFCIPAMLIYFKKERLPTLGMLDIIAVTTCIVHALGRLGCYMAGCCYGIEWHGPLATTFTNEACLAPLYTPLHSTQLYSASMIVLIMIIILIIKNKKQFSGQLFLVYLMLYSLGRSVIEIFRGDENRGYVIGEVVSNSQFISLMVLIISVYYYVKLKNKASSLNN